MNAIVTYLNTQPRWSTAGLYRFSVNSAPLGWVEPRIAQILCMFSPYFQIDGLQLNLSVAPTQIEQQMNEAALHLREHGLIKAWRDERYAVHPFNQAGELSTQLTLFTLERGAFRRFGLCSKAVHINGWCSSGDLWLGRRARTKGIDPNMLDNIAAGGIPHGETPGDCVIRELAEEAAVPFELAIQAKLSGELRTCRNEGDGFHDEVLYCYDLMLPDDFVPNNLDGEVAEFRRVSSPMAITLLPEMTWDAGLVTAKFLQQNGY